MIETGSVKFDFKMAMLYIAPFHPLLKTCQKLNFALSSSIMMYSWMQDKYQWKENFLFNQKQNLHYLNQEQ